MVWKMQKESFIHSISFIKGAIETPESVVIDVEASNKKIVNEKMNKFPFAYNNVSEFEIIEHILFTSFEVLLLE